MQQDMWYRCSDKWMIATRMWEPFMLRLQRWCEKIKSSDNDDCNYDVNENDVFWWLWRLQLWCEKYEHILILLVVENMVWKLWTFCDNDGCNYNVKKMYTFFLLLLLTTAQGLIQGTLYYVHITFFFNNGFHSV